MFVEVEDECIGIQGFADPLLSTREDFSHLSCVEAAKKVLLRKSESFLCESQTVILEWGASRLISACNPGACVSHSGWVSQDTSLQALVKVAYPPARPSCNFGKICSCSNVGVAITGSCEMRQVAVSYVTYKSDRAPDPRLPDLTMWQLCYRENIEVRFVSSLKCDIVVDEILSSNNAMFGSLDSNEVPDLSALGDEMYRSGEGLRKLSLAPRAVQWTDRTRLRQVRFHLSVPGTDCVAVKRSRDLHFVSVKV